MERLLQYVWKHKMFPLKEQFCTDGMTLEIIDPGLQNLDAGPDFFNAKIKIDGTLWVGNVEIHDRSSYWYQHGHHTDKNYNNVILHVAEDVNMEVKTESGSIVPQFQLCVPQRIKSEYEQLLSADRYPPCYKVIPKLPRLVVHSWMTALQTERLEEKTRHIQEIASRCNGDWEKAYFVTLSRYFGFGVNGDAFEQWALSIPMNSVAHHHDNLLQIEAIFMGQASLFTRLDSDYAKQLEREYTYLQHKFSLRPVNPLVWKYLRLRPNNFPHVRVSQLANLYFNGRTTLSKLVGCTNVKELRELFDTQATDLCNNSKKMSVSSRDLLIINVAIPMLFAYGKHKGDETLCVKALALFDELKAEKNHIVTMWSECGLEVSNAGDSQALIQLKKEYCDKKDCLRCRIGYEYLKSDKK